MIDEQLLLEKLEELIEYDTFDVYQEEPKIDVSFETLEDIIVSQPKVGEWIPVEEADHKTSDWILLQYDRWDIMCVGFFDTKSGRYVTYDASPFDGEVIAWMPLPPAYKGE